MPSEEAYRSQYTGDSPERLQRPFSSAPQQYDNSDEEEIPGVPQSRSNDRIPAQGYNDSDDDEQPIESGPNTGLFQSQFGSRNPFDTATSPHGSQSPQSAIRTSPPRNLYEQERTGSQLSMNRSISGFPERPESRASVVRSPFGLPKRSESRMSVIRNPYAEGRERSDSHLSNASSRNPFGAAVASPSLARKTPPPPPPRARERGDRGLSSRNPFAVVASDPISTYGGFDDQPGSRSTSRLGHAAGYGVFDDDLPASLSTSRLAQITIADDGYGGFDSSDPEPARSLSRHQ